MSVKRIILAIVAVILVGGFIYLGVTSLIKAQDEKLRYERELHNKSLDIKRLETKEEKLEQEKLKAEQEKILHEQELQKKSQQEQEMLERQKQLEAELYSKLENKKKIALASANTTAVDSSSTAPADTNTVLQLIRDASARYGVSEAMMIRLAKCESTLGANLTNPKPVVDRYGVNHGHAAGIFQFIPSTWTRMSTEAGFAGKSVYDSYANVNTAAHAFSTGKKGEWECQ